MRQSFQLVFKFPELRLVDFLLPLAIAVLLSSLRVHIVDQVLAELLALAVARIHRLH